MAKCDKIAIFVIVMTDKYTEKSKIRYAGGIQEVADYLMLHPEAMRRDIVTIFGKKYNKAGRTIDRWIREARDINRRRSDEIAKKDAEVIAEISQGAKEAILSRMETLAFLSDVIKGKTKKTAEDGAEIEDAIAPNYANRLQACQLLSKMCGWDSPEKKELSINSNVAEMTDEQLNEQLEELKNKK